MSLNRLSDKLVFNILAGINVGYLEITNYQGEVFKFGNPQDNLKAKFKIKKHVQLLVTYILIQSTMSNGNLHHDLFN